MVEADGAEEEEASLVQNLRTADWFGDCDLLLACKYNPASHINRDHVEGLPGALFPEEYVAALASRAVACARGSGFRERVEEAKNRGARARLLPVYRPPALDHRYLLSSLSFISDLRSGAG